MRHLNLLTSVLVVAASAAPAAAAVPTAAAVVPGYGKIIAVPHAANRPDPHLRYRVIFSVTKPAAAPAAVNPSLDKVARFLNLLGSEGIRPAKGDVVVIVHGGATPLVLSDQAYRARTGVANPNIALVRELASAGVAVHVCAQALHGQKISEADVAPNIVVDLSALTTIATLQLKGWALMPD